MFIHLYKSPREQQSLELSQKIFNEEASTEFGVAVEGENTIISANVEEPQFTYIGGNSRKLSENEFVRVLAVA